MTLPRLFLTQSEFDALYDATRDLGDPPLEVKRWKHRVIDGWVVRGDRTEKKYKVEGESTERALTLCSIWIPVIQLEKA